MTGVRVFPGGRVPSGTDRAQTGHRRKAVVGVGRHGRGGRRGL
ncbi:MAG: hypothetical protein ABSA77_12085 [Thermoguttaceae bacterium]